MIFRTLSMAGFKSFAEKTEIDIETGLTGIVGPNGCGKSNVVEAIRWVMGESNARQMRGSEMDDVIFAGTDKRPARSIAEISLSLDNQSRKAPAEFNQHDELHISRKIERGKGSQYQVNGKPARAKDVQLLFADTASGARSAGIVSQGRIGAIVGAKPEDRRSLIEEAANIKGLHQRKHEAELRLKNTEINLERIQDVITQLEEQRGQLAKQARQAARYASVADRIRKAEAQLFQARWQTIQNEKEQAVAALGDQEKKVADATQQSAKAATQQAQTAAELPLLRQKEAEAAAEMQRLRLAISEFDREADRIAAALLEIQNQLQQIDADTQRETHLFEDASNAITALDEEKRSLNTALSTTQPEYEQAIQALAELQKASEQADMLAADAASIKNNAEANIRQLETQMQVLTRRIEQAKNDFSEIDLDSLEQQATEASQALEAAQHNAKQAEKSRITAQDTLNLNSQNYEAIRDNTNQAESQKLRLSAEIDALAYLLAENLPDDGTPAADTLEVEEGYEAALSACLGSDIMYPFDAGSHGYWRRQFSAETAVSPPDFGTPLAHFIGKQNGLMHAISGVAVIADDAQALDAQKMLKPGQMLVNKAGHLYRWDGLVKLQAASAEAERIKQKQRLDLLQSEHVKAEEQYATLLEQHDTAKAQLAHSRTHLADTQNTFQQADQALREAERNNEKSKLAVEAGRNRINDILSVQRNAQHDLDQLQAQYDIQADIEKLAHEANEKAEQAQTAKTALNDANAHTAALAQQIQTANNRLQDIIRQEADWNKRLAQTDSRKNELEARRTLKQNEYVQLQSKPEQIEQDKQKALSLSEQSEYKHQTESDRLRQAENTLLEQDRESKQCAELLATCREELIRCEARSERAVSEEQNLSAHIAEKLQLTPDQLHTITGITTLDEGTTSLEKLEASLQRLLREREQIGPVNLRAEVEMQDLDRRMDEMKSECEDLNEAIAKLRTAISSLNREGRMRLLNSFAEVNGHFTHLFTQLFGGGHAELQLTESDDPLQAGLEIMASPPGKKLQSLSLLSGGEQALTALAIIFAVFLTNPAPICILDEVDAPLDDGNVERFCDLLAQIAQQTQTRFLVVTHHRMTMARMDRLFGVTMEHQGISRLVSVDLQTAEAMRERIFA